MVVCTIFCAMWSNLRGTWLQAGFPRGFPQGFPHILLMTQVECDSGRPSPWLGCPAAEISARILATDRAFRSEIELDDDREMVGYRVGIVIVGYLDLDNAVREIGADQDVVDGVATVGVALPAR